MTIDRRQKNKPWHAASDNGHVSVDQATIAVLMDIRDELQALVRLANCYRLPRALDARIELGAEARRRKRNAAKKRKVARARD